MNETRVPQVKQNRREGIELYTGVYSIGDTNYITSYHNVGQMGNTTPYRARTSTTGCFSRFSMLAYFVQISQNGAIFILL